MEMSPSMSTWVRVRTSPLPADLTALQKLQLQNIAGTPSAAPVPRKVIFMTQIKPELS